MTIENINEYLSLEKDEQDRLVNVIVHGNEGMPEIVIGSQDTAQMEEGKSALRAAVDLIRHGLYSHPLTTTNLHIYKKSGEFRNLPYMSNIGVISSTYAGDLPFPVPNETEYPEGWAQLNLRAGRYRLSAFNPKYEALRSRKHDFVQMMLEGYTLIIRVLPWNVNKGDDGMGLADHLLATWMEEDDEVAWQMRIDGFRRKAAREYMRKPILQGRQSPKAMEAARTRYNGDTIVTLVSGKEMPIKKLALGRYRVLNGSTVLNTVPWDGSR